MNQDILKPIKLRAKEMLQLEADLSVFELAELLRRYRNESHPDRFRDEAAKRQADQRFKGINTLLEELEHEIELDRLTRKPSELALYKPLYDSQELQADLDRANQQIEILRSEIEALRVQLSSAQEESKSLTAKLHEKNSDSLRAEVTHLQSIYRASARGLAPIGLAMGIAAVLAVMVQMENVSALLQRYSPLNTGFISNALFVFFCLALAVMFRNVWESNYVRRRAEELCSPAAVDDFLEFLALSEDDGELPDEFTESDVFRFVSRGNRRLMKVIALLGFRINGQETRNRLKDIFVHNLLNKRLVEISKAKTLQRYFKMVSSFDSGMHWYEMYRLEKQRNDARESSDKEL